MENNILTNLGDKHKALILVCGAPASGKSTWSKKFIQKHPEVVYVSTDEIRAEIGKGEDDQNVSAQAFTIARKRVSTALAENKSVIIDATSVTRKARKDWINLGKGHSAYIIAVAFELPREELYKRDAQRSRVVGTEIIDRFFNKYERPSIGTENIDKVIIK